MQGFRRLFLRSLRGEKSREHSLIVISGIVLTCLVAFLYLFQPQLLSSLDLKVYDTLMKSRSARTVSENIVIVAIDEKSLAQYGQWPWPRYRVAQLLDTLRDRGALSVGIDILFAEPDRSSLVNIQKNIMTDFRYSVGLSGIPRQYIDNDAILAEALRRGPFVLGYQFLFGERIAKACTLHPTLIHRQRKQETSLVPQARGVIIFQHEKK